MVWSSILGWSVQTPLQKMQFSMAERVTGAKRFLGSATVGVATEALPSSTQAADMA
jgi:hypothetical protein